MMLICEITNPCKSRNSYVSTAICFRIRHPNQDFFIADIFDALPVKNDRHTMEHPFFTLSTKPDIRVVEYKRDGVKIRLNPSP